MLSNRVRLKLNKEQQSLCWGYAKVSRRYWNLLVFLDREVCKGEFDDYLADKGLKVYHSEFYDRDVYQLDSVTFLHLVKHYIFSLTESEQGTYAWYFQPNQSFIYSSLVREFLKVKCHNKGKVNFRSVGKATPSFYVRCDQSGNKKRPSRIYQKSNHRLQIPTLGGVRFGSIRKGFDLSCKKQTAKVVFDGKYWVLTYTELRESNPAIETTHSSEGVGIDLGIKTLATMSDGTVVPNIRTFRRVRILRKRLKRLQRKLSRKYQINQCNQHHKTKNIIKLERKIRLIHRTLKHIRMNHIREWVAKLVKKQPRFVALEDLNVKGMLKNKHLSKEIANCAFYAIKAHLLRKAKDRQIEVRLVNRFFPSSKTCSSCGFYKKDLTLNDRTFSCNQCQNCMDRDLNAACNLAQTCNYVLI